MGKNTIEGLTASILLVNPNVTVTIIEGDHGKALKIQGKGSKIVAWYWNSERYLDGYVDTDWSKVAPRHGLGYLIPLYENPLNSIL